MLQLENVSVVFNQEKSPFYALDNINLQVEKGKCLAILGKSGCGKSTLLNIMAGLKKPSKGIVRYCGKELMEPASDISMIFQNYGLFPWKSVRENLILPIRLKKGKVEEQRLDELVEQLGLKDQLKKYPAQLSGGQKQRVSIGRAVFNDAKLLLMDEPFSALDPLTRENLQIHLQQLFVEKNITTVIVTHNIDEAVSWGDRIAIFHQNGATITEIIDNSTNQNRDIKRCVEQYLMGA